MKVVKKFESKRDASTKHLQKTNDGFLIESGFYSLEEDIICISTQIGCSVGCIFCATSDSNGFIRNLTTKEIVGQVEGIIKLKRPKKKLLFSFMGMGEPLLNYDNLVEATRILGGKYKGGSRATIATSGVNLDAIRKLAEEKFPILVKLHLSFHAPNDVLRKKIIPKAKPLRETLEAVEYFSNKTKTPVKLIYALIKDLNDHPEQAQKLGELVKDKRLTVKLSQLSPFRNFLPTTKARLNRFEKILEEKGIETVRFVSRGQDIQAACGQLRYYH